MRVLITQQARGEILAATGVGAQSGIELGGSIMAHEADGEILVAYALPVGPHAEQGPGHVRTDAAYQNAAIELVRRRYPALSYAGDWHVHPMWLPRLSATDERTARSILKDDGKSRDHLVLLIGTPPRQGKPVVVGFLARLGKPSGVDVEETKLEIVEDDSAEVRGHLGHALQRLEDLLQDPAADPAAYQHDASRIEADLDEIREELGASASLRVSDDLLGAVVSLRGREAVICFPPEYPRGAPQVFSGSLARGPLTPVELRYAWSSRHRLVDVVAEALAPSFADRALSLVFAVASFATRSRAARRRALRNGAAS